MYFDGIVNVFGNEGGDVIISQKESNILFQSSYSLIAQTIQLSMRLIVMD
jgi:hypothetical protein